CAGHLRWRGKEHLRQGPESAAAARLSGAIWGGQRAGTGVRSDSAFAKGVDIPDAADARASYRHARGARAEVARGVRGDRQRKAEAAHRTNLQAGSRSASAT